MVDLDRRTVLLHEHVAHGIASGTLMAERFGDGQQKTPLGVHLTAAKPYEGRRGHSLRLIGLEPRITGRSLERAVVLHGAPYGLCMTTQLISYLWRHRWHALFAPIAALTLVTLGHELGHGFFVWLQGLSPLIGGKDAIMHQFRSLRSLRLPAVSSVAVPPPARAPAQGDRTSRRVPRRRRRAIAPLVVGLSAAVAMLAACGDFQIEEGSGIKDVQAREAEGFSGLEVHGGLDVTLLPGDSQGVVLSGDDNLLPLIRTVVKDDTLIIEPLEDHLILMPNVRLVTRCDHAVVDQRHRQRR